MVLPEPGPPTSSVVRPSGKPPPVISSKPVMPVGAFFSPLTRGDWTGLILFPAGSTINSTTARAGGNTHAEHWLCFARPIVAIATCGQLTPVPATSGGVIENVRNYIACGLVRPPPETW